LREPAIGLVFLSFANGGTHVHQLRTIFLRMHNKIQSAAEEHPHTVPSVSDLFIFFSSRHLGIFQGNILSQNFRCLCLISDS